MRQDAVEMTGCGRQEKEWCSLLGKQAEGINSIDHRNSSTDEEFQHGYVQNEICGTQRMALPYNTRIVISTAVTSASAEYTHLRQLSLPASKSIPSLVFYSSHKEPQISLTGQTTVSGHSVSKRCPDEENSLDSS